MMLTPHGPGFSFLDTLAVVKPGKRARGTKWLDPKSAFFADHFPGNPLMPGVLLIECGAQTVGALWMNDQSRDKNVAPTNSAQEAPLTCRSGIPAATVVLASVQQFRFLKPVLPAQTVEVEVALEKDFGALAQFDVILSVDHSTVAQGKLTMSRSNE